VLEEVEFQSKEAKDFKGGLNVILSAEVIPTGIDTSSFDSLLLAIAAAQVNSHGVFEPAPATGGLG
jgi:hypothetical protein